MRYTIHDQIDTIMNVIAGTDDLKTAQEIAVSLSNSEWLSPHVWVIDTHTGEKVFDTNAQ